MAQRFLTPASILLVALLVPLAAAGQGNRIPPTRVPQSEEPPLADSKNPPNTPLPAAPGMPRTGTPYAPRPEILTPSTPSTATEPPTPVVAIHVRAPATIAVGANDTTVTITAENRSQANAYHVRVSYPTPANVTLVGDKIAPTPKESQLNVLRWEFDVLKPGEKKDISITYTPKDDNDIKHVARVSFEHGQQVIIKQNRPDIQVQRIGPTNLHENETADVKVVVENKGKAEARNVVVSDALDEGVQHDQPDEKGTLSWPAIPTLKPGEKKELTYRIKAARSGTYSNNISVIASNVPLIKKQSTLLVGKALLEIKIAGPERVYITQPAAFEITARNTGTLPMDNVAVAYQLKNVKVLRASQGAQQFPDRLQWVIKRFEPGATQRFTVTVQGQAVQQTMNIVEILGRNTKNDHHLRTDFVGAPALELRARAERNPVEVGQKVNITLTLRNSGPVPARDVTLTIKHPTLQLKFLPSDPRVSLIKDGELGTTKLSVRPKEAVPIILTFETVAEGSAVFEAQMESPDLDAKLPVTVQEHITITPAMK